MPRSQRSFTLLDKFCIGLDQALRTISDNASVSGAPYPASDQPEADLTPSEQQVAIALMRVNHAGEIAAQALYHGQALVSHSLETAKQMQHAALEEGDHLAWCKKRLDELGGHTSYLKPLWYGGSLLIGMMAGVVGDKWSLGFVAETEQQVIKHLTKHLQRLPEKDKKSMRILQQMEKDEGKHRDEAIAAGAYTLPVVIKKMMSFTSQVMVKTAYWI